MDYQVPQFIDVEDKIFGPLTLKQFIYLAGGIGICVGVFLYLPLIFALLIGIPVLGFVGALAFYKINGKPFIEILEAGFNYYIGRHLYLWKKEKEPETVVVAPQVPVAETRQRIGLSESKLHELAWSLDIKDQGEGGTGAPQ